MVLFVRRIFMLILIINLVQSRKVDLCCINKQCNFKTVLEFLDHKNVTNSSLVHLQCPDVLVDCKYRDIRTLNMDHITIQGTQEPMIPGNYCIATSSYDGIVVRLCKPKSFCNNHPCIPQCNFNSDGRDNVDYSDKQSMHLKSNIMAFPHMAMHLFNFDMNLNNGMDYGILYHNDANRFRMVNKRWFISKSGYLWVSDKWYTVDEYCVNIENRNGYEQWFVYAATKETISCDTIIHIISTVSLFACLLINIVYRGTKEKHDAFMCYFLVTYLTLFILELVLKLRPVHGSNYTLFWGNIITFFTLASGAWCTVMIADVYWNVASSLKVFPMDYVFKTKTRVSRCCASVWFLALIHMQLIYLIDYWTTAPSKFKPDISWVTGTFTFAHGKFFYFISVRIIQFVVDVVLVCTSSSDSYALDKKIKESLGFFSSIDNKNIYYGKKITSNMILLVILQIPFIFEMAATMLEMFLESMKNKPSLRISQRMASVDLLTLIYMHLHSFEGIFIFVFFGAGPVLLNRLRRRRNNEM